MPETNRGNLVEKTIRDHCRTTGVKITDILKQLDIDRSTAYRHFKKPDLAFSLVKKYGDVIGFDFRSVIPEMPDTIIDEKALLLTPEQDLQDRFNKLLVDYTELQKEHIELLKRLQKSV